MILVERLSKKFYLTKKTSIPFFNKSESITAVHDVSFKCAPGRIFGLIGPNGAGKTTILRMLVGMLKPSNGSVSICNTDMIKNPEEAKRKIGFMSMNTGLYERLTVNEIIKYFADLYGVDENDFTERKNNLFNKVDMHSMSNRTIGKLSTGMQQKVSIVRTLIHNPDVIIFDEATTGLDVTTSQNIVKLLQEFKGQGKTIIFSTHRINEIKILCDDMAIIDKGILKYTGTYQNFIDKMQEKTFEDELIRLIEN